jgi:DNA-binding NarL/FixJ family response regulator
MKDERTKQGAIVEDKQRILLVDDHPVVCEGLAQKINGEPDLQVCGQAHDVHTALAAIEKLKPHIVVVDIALGTGSGVELIKDIKVQYPHLPALVLSMHEEGLYAERSLHAGAKGYIMKQEPPDVLLRAIRQVLRGQVYLSEKVRDGIVNRLGGSFPGGEITSVIKLLSDRELEVFELIGDGFATHAIAAQLHLSMKTIASHRENIKRKLNLANGEGLVRFAIHWQRYRGGADATEVFARVQQPKPGSPKRKSR